MYECSGGPHAGIFLNPRELHEPKPRELHEPRYNGHPTIATYFGAYCALAGASAGVYAGRGSVSQHRTTQSRGE